MANGNLIEQLRMLLLLCREIADRHPDAEIGRIADELERLIHKWDADSPPEAESPSPEVLN